jgi:uncharacterized protein
MIKRELYLHKLRQFINKPQIKILSGIRRSGKSTVLLLLKQQLIEMNVAENQIIYLNFESFETISLQSAQSLYRFIKEKIINSEKYYLLLDEIQEVYEWEKVINSLMTDFNVDMYLTGSNSHMLSSELATYLAGRYVEIPIYTLSFAEYLQFRQFYFPNEQNALHDSFEQYMRSGAFPVIHTADYSEETAGKVVFDIYSSIILRDTVQRYKIRDVELLERVVNYVFDNIGNTFSGKNIADFFKSQQRKIDINTVYNYLYALEGAFILFRTPRYDLKGREILKTFEKFYVSDLSIVFALKGFQNRMISGILENMIYLELKRKEYKVFVGKFADKEIDFIAEKQGEKIYVQVAYKLESEQTVQREFQPLLYLKDQYPKYVVSMDTFWKENVEGIRHFHIADFLLKEKYL